MTPVISQFLYLTLAFSEPNACHRRDLGCLVSGELTQIFELVVACSWREVRTQTARRRRSISVARFRRKMLPGLSTHKGACGLNLEILWYEVRVPEGSHPAPDRVACRRPQLETAKRNSRALEAKHLCGDRGDRRRHLRSADRRRVR